MAGSIWFTIVIIVLVVIVVLKLVMKKQAIATRLAFFLFLFFIMTFGYVYVQSDVKINSVGTFFDFGGTYFSWLFSSFNNLKTITANVINQDWSVSNSTTRG